MSTHRESSMSCVVSGLCAIESHTWIAPCAKARSDAEIEAAQTKTNRIESEMTIPPGTLPPKITVEVWDGEDRIDATVADVVRIDDTWHVVATVDD